jgi:NAD(P)-dependent dehydrogenase (short-subunit alcohol dehydrogenase family)
MILKGKTCVIVGTGSPKGIGRATARLFAEQGAQLVLADRTFADNLTTDFAESMRQDTGITPSVISVACDITDSEQCSQLVASAEAKFGTIDVLVNTAGIVETRSLLETTADDLDRMIGVNLKGAFNLCQAVLRRFVAQKSGVIVNLASLAAQRGGGLVGGAHYASAKGGVISLTRSIAREFGPQGIRANVICPAMVQTAMVDHLSNTELDAIRDTIPLRRLGTAREVAGACLFLASDLSGFVTGATIDVNGGLHIH